MAQSTINFRIDEEVKKNMEQACKEMGLSVTSAFTLFATKVGREKRIPFEISSDPFYSIENQERLKRSIAQMEATGGTVHEVDYDKILDWWSLGGIWVLDETR